MATLLSAFLGLLLLISVSASEDDLVLVTSTGPIRGKRVLTGSGSVTAYLGIPYAEPPVGKLRFQKPHPHQPWSHVLETTQYGHPCLQRDTFSYPALDIWVANASNAEDCLFLNVWVPHPRPSMPVPILAWIHGGGFMTGAASMDLYNGATLAATENIIVASMNYRLGALGFLYFPPDASGNMGLWDQHLALKWLNENAAAFGGNVSQLTLVGHSAGAAAVGYHLLSPASQPLFAHAVMQSGSPSSSWAWKHPEAMKQSALYLGDIVQCPKHNYSAVVSCLQDTEIGAKVFYHVDALFSPTSDGDFLPDEPRKLLQSGRIPAKPLLTGVTKDDGSVLVPYGVPDAQNDDAVLTREHVLQGMSFVLPKPMERNVTLALVEKYTEDSHGPGGYRQALSHFWRDYYFFCPMADVIESMASVGGPVYTYSFDHHIPGPMWREWMGAAHGAEVPYLFGTLSVLLGVNGTSTEADAAVSRKVMRYWAEFSRSGNPSGSPSNELLWPPYNDTEEKYFHISSGPHQIKKIYPAGHCNFLKKHIFSIKDTSEQSVPFSRPELR
ncbi:cholinesterase-like [Varanus komodoensis]|uniref:Carboxylic ester hydrolase n=1 Tax=Varanus komodoensis TaxID=61221 RepID=A0A8D2LBZ8_VARKO|nr:cholinesterase-like [Varanus komodoensis]